MVRIMGRSLSCHRCDQQDVVFKIVPQYPQKVVCNIETIFQRIEHATSSRRNADVSYQTSQRASLADSADCMNAWITP